MIDKFKNIGLLLLLGVVTISCEKSEIDYSQSMIEYYDGQYEKDKIINSSFFVKEAIDNRPLIIVTQSSEENTTKIYLEINDKTGVEMTNREPGAVMRSSGYVK